MADEVYERLVLSRREIGDSAPSILRLATRDDAVMVVQSFSKSYCMTGWRVGWMVAREDLAAPRDEVERVHGFSCAELSRSAPGKRALEWGEDGPCVDCWPTAKPTATSALRRCARCRA